jgi:hypothetical protein
MGFYVDGSSDFRAEEMILQTQNLADNSRFDPNVERMNERV